MSAVTQLHGERKKAGFAGASLRKERNKFSGRTKLAAQIKLEISVEEFQVAKGVRQGDPLSPKLFSAILESVFRDLEWQKDGINIDGKKLNHLRFADDPVLITDNATTLQHMLQQLTEASRKVGQIIAFKDQTNIEIERRVANAWNRYWSLKEILKSEHFPIGAKRKVFNVQCSCVLPCLTYGCQTWALSQKHLLKLRTCQRGMERSMIGFTKRDRIRSEEIRSITKVEDIIKKIRQLKWRWTGHMTRDSRIKWTKIITEWQPRDGTRKRGRQAKRWMDDIRKIGEATWSRKARDRGVEKAGRGLVIQLRLRDVIRMGEYFRQFYEKGPEEYARALVHHITKFVCIDNAFYRLS
ncbi:Putative uncharacterized transposon-derived protein F52C9.6 [Eumeta japonica]|uniref:Uncharacterized transposon-derived protein F52C9.6 n=1 Tax=Eumeta variegata TaxID=151549 RepID=A0A4C1ZSZ5_EUMVA|nr:Putative uncharacterized transposon-derived protein F52C9.6 [Eumeta japonica]